MKAPLLFAVLYYLVACCVAKSIWPQPSEISSGNATLTIAPSLFSIKCSSPSAIIQKAIVRYEHIIFPFKLNEEHVKITSNENALAVSTLVINIKSSVEDLFLGVSENYTLRVDDGVSILNADTVFGALRGLESFSQLVDYDWRNRVYAIHNAPIVISDYPRFPWRGLMIDTSRHYLKVSTVLTMIDAVSYNKMNTLHWHIVDLQSFPLELNSYPRMSQYGAWSPDSVYTQNDVKMVIQYALERGVRVIPEFDVPGHTYSWGLGYPELIINCTVASDWGSEAVTLDITKENTYVALQAIFGEVRNLFIDEYIHFGGDEVFYECWNSSNVVKAFMQARNISTFPLLQQYFVDRLGGITQKLNIKSRLFWEDSWANNNLSLPVDTTTFEIWWSVENLIRAVQQGYKIVKSVGSYLDVQKPGPDIHYEWVDTWQDFYTNDPLGPETVNLTSAQQQLVLGGEACMWGEAVDDESIFPRVWIRASGTAEQLWSTQNFTSHFDVDAAQARLIEFRCRLKQRGVNATPVRPDYCPLPK